MPGFLMDFVRTTKKYISEKLGFESQADFEEVQNHFASRKRSFESNDIDHSSPKLRRITDSYLRDPGSIFMPDNLSSENNKVNIQSFMNTMNNVKKCSNSDMFSVDRIHEKSNNPALDSYSLRIDQALNCINPGKVLNLPYAFTAPANHRPNISSHNNLPDLHPINRSLNKRRSLARPRVGGGVTKRYTNNIFNLNNSQTVRDPQRVPNLMQSLFAEPQTNRMISLPKANLHVQQQHSINSIVRQFEKNQNKQKYEQLLQHLAPSLYNNVSATSNSTLINRRKSLIPPKEFIDLDDESDQQPSTSNRKGVQQNRSKIRNEIDTIDLSTDDDQLKAIMQGYIEQRRAAKKALKSSDEPIEIIEITDTDYVTPVNTLKDKLESRPQNKNDLVSTVDRRYKERLNQRSEQINDEKENLRKLQEDRSEQERFITDKFRDFTIISDIIVLDDEDEKEEIDEYPPITKLHHNLLRHALAGRKDETIVSKFSINITRQDLNTLVGSNWLNDEVINFYMNLLVERSEKRADDDYPKVYSMNTFFIPKLLQSGHAGLRRWTRKVDIFAHDVIPVPVHVGEVHWCMAIIHMKNKTIKYYDSMGKANDRVLDALEQYLKDECMDKKKEKFDMDGWEKVSVLDCPRQMNGSDCGVFSCMFAEFVSRDRDITFSQQHMPYFRQKMICEIASGEMWL